MKRTSHVLIAALFAAVVVHVSVAWQDLPTLARNGYLYDDSFYAFQIARNIAEGKGPSFDGVHPTNGFQPLYVFLLVPFYRIAGGDAALPIHLALVMLALLSVGTAYLLYLILERYVGPGVAAATSVLWVFSPVVFRQTANGLETALALFLLAATVHYYLTRIRSADEPGTFGFVRLGALLGLCVLARLDLVFLALAMTLDYLVVSRARGTHAGARHALTALGTTFVVYAPWLVYGLVAVGHLLPESGAATRFLSIAYAPFFGLSDHDLVASGPDAGFVWAHVVNALAVLKLAPATHAFFRAAERFTAGTPVERIAELVANALGLAMLAAFAVWVFVRERRDGGARMRELNFLLLFGVALMAAYSLYVFGVFFFIRYFYPVYFVATIFLALFLQDIVGRVRVSSVPVRRAAMAACALYATAHLVMGFNCCYRSTPVYHFYDVARWVEENTGEDDTIGVFQSGAIGYLSNRKVVNLDGKVNHEALEALRRGSLDSYLRSSGVNVVMDHRRVLTLFLGPGNGEDQEGVGSTRLFTNMVNGVPGWIGYRLNGGAGHPAGAGSEAPEGSLSGSDR